MSITGPRETHECLRKNPQKGHPFLSAVRHACTNNPSLNIALFTSEPTLWVGALPLTLRTAPHDNWDLEFGSIFLHEPRSPKNTIKDNRSPSCNPGTVSRLIPLLNRYALRL